MCYVIRTRSCKENRFACQLVQTRTLLDWTSRMRRALKAGTTIDSTNRGCYGNSSMFNYGHTICYSILFIALFLTEIY